MKRVYTLNARRMETKESAHTHLKRRLRLPDYYGGNLDALADCLGEIGEPAVIRVRYAGRPDETYGAGILRVLQEAAERNANITLELRDAF